MPIADYRLFVNRDLPMRERACPRCGSTDAVQILYGYPSSELGEAEQRGEVVLGGCMVWPESPDYQCRSCGSALPWVADWRLK